MSKLGEVLVDDLRDGTGLPAEIADDLPVHTGDGFLDAFEVAGKLSDQRQQVRITIEHLVVTSGRDLAAGRDAVAFGCQRGDLGVEPL